MKMIFFFISLISFNTFSNQQCINHGDCQTNTQASTSCFIVKTGTDFNGNVTCSLRCYSVDLGQYCHKEDDKFFGLCKEEEHLDMPVFNREDPNRCDSAIDVSSI